MPVNNHMKKIIAIITFCLIVVICGYLQFVLIVPFCLGAIWALALTNQKYIKKCKDFLLKSHIKTHK